MRKAMTHTMERESSEAIHFNYNKLQAVACITCSAAVSISGIYWLLHHLF